MKIIEIGTGYTPIPAKIGAATEIVIENLLSEFENLNVSAELIDIAYSRDDVLSDELLYNARVNRILVPKWLNQINDRGIIHYLRRIIYSYRVGVFLKKSLKNEEENIFLHFHNQFNYFIIKIILNGMLKRNNIKTIYTIHSPNWLTIKEVPKKYLLEKNAIENSTYVIALTEKIRVQIYSLIPTLNQKKINVIPNGVSSRFFNVLNDKFKENSIINVGAICDRKNQLGTIKYLKQFLLENDFVFKFAGKIVEPYYFKMIRNYISANSLENHVEYVGEITPGNDLNVFYNRAKFYVSHSKQEACISLVVLEAMLAGCPVILDKTFEELLDNNTNVSEVIEIIDSQKNTSKLKELLHNNNSYEFYRKAQIDLVKEEYSWNKVAISLIKILNKKT